MEMELTKNANLVGTDKLGQSTRFLAVYSSL